MAAISVRDLTKQFGPVLAVHDLSFDVEQATVTGFLGPNGAGKTTTLRSVLGLVTPTSVALIGVVLGLATTIVTFAVAVPWLAARDVPVPFASADVLGPVAAALASTALFLAYGLGFAGAGAVLLSRRDVT